ncbi:mitochondrial sodium/calcium exchanger protein isoform X2 [Ambystoma mexicanum]|uniref:mitochondrial sodium/calcium exchanger protein isoform X2 n=1 Tax=Ambystoma mexicanum TaxID=8296 RepID=UPI0037E981A0
MPLTTCLLQLLVAAWLPSCGSGAFTTLPPVPLITAGGNNRTVGTHVTPCPSISQAGGSSDDCRTVRERNSSEWCAFVSNTPDCQDDDGFLDYLNAAFCAFTPSLLPLAITLYAFWLLYLFLVLGTTADKYFCPNLSAISTNLKLSHNVAGVTFLAFGNGAPDVFSAVVAFSDPRTAGLAIGALFGAGVFVTTVVAGGISMVKPFTAASRPFLRDIIFYILAVFLTFFLLYLGRIRLGEALGYLGLYIFYVLVVVLSTWIYKRSQGQGMSTSILGEPGDEYQPLITYGETTAQILLHSLNPVDWRKWRRKPWHWRLIKIIKMPIEIVLLLTVPVVDPDKEDRNWKRPLNCLHVITSPLVCVLTLKSGTYGLYRIQDVFPVWTVLILVAAPMAVIVFFITKNEVAPKYHCIFSFLGFLVSALWINAAATEAVNLLRTFGVIFKLSNTVLGLTLLAWGNSIGDFFSDLTMARQGYPRMAISACFGGIIFNVLVGVGLGCLLQMSREKTVLALHHEGLTWILAGALGLSLVISLIVVPMLRFHLNRTYGVGLVLFYLIFLLVALLTEFDIIKLNVL